MDGSKFDDLTKGLATGRTRRSVLKGLVGGGAALIAGRSTGVLAAKETKVTICHLGEGGVFEQIIVSESAVSAHLAHGDVELGTDDNCSACGDACTGYNSCVGGLCGCIEETQAQTCGELCGPQSNNCGIEVPCEPCEPEGCEPGQYIDGDDCGTCLPGYYSTNGISCTPCAPGTFSDSPGTVVCSACPAGSYASVGAQVACIQCECGGTCNAVTGECAGPGLVPVYGECLVDSDCSSGQCGCNGGPAEYGPCFCRFAECFALGVECSTGYGAVSCCEGDCYGSPGAFYCTADYS